YRCGTGPTPWPVLPRHPVSLAVAAEPRGTATRPSLHGRHRLFLGPVLPLSADRNDLPEPGPVGDPPPVGWRRRARGRDRPQPLFRTRAGAAAGGRGRRLRRPLRGQGRAQKERRALPAGGGERPDPRLPAGAVRAGDSPYP